LASTGEWAGGWSIDSWAEEIAIGAWRLAPEDVKADPDRCFRKAVRRHLLDYAQGAGAARATPSSPIERFARGVMESHRTAHRPAGSAD